MDKAVTLDEVISLTSHLSLLDKVRLLNHSAPQIERELKMTQPTARISLRGLWKGVNITEEDIAEVRREM